MLVLSRKIGQSIIINDSITVTIVACDGKKVRLGVIAPPEVRVDREEIHRLRQEFFDVEIDAESMAAVG